MPIPDAWPEVIFVLVILAFLLIAMLIAGIFRYRFSASPWKFTFEPTAPKDAPTKPLATAPEQVDENKTRRRIPWIRLGR